MSYEIEKLSPLALKKIAIVLDDINLKSELRRRKYRLLCRPGKIEGVDDYDHERILVYLAKDGLIKERKCWSFIMDGYMLDIQDSFNEFYDKVKNAISGKIIEIPQELTFDSHLSVLYLNGKKINISKRKGLTKGHYILKYIFASEDGLNFDHALSEIADQEFADAYDKPDSAKLYVKACEYINETIRKQSGYENFLIFGTGKTGTVKINEKYLN